jgi:hypothetical protein
MHVSLPTFLRLLFEPQNSTPLEGALHWEERGSVSNPDLFYAMEMILGSCLSSLNLTLVL